MDMLLELLTNPRVLQKRGGQPEPFQFEKLERSLMKAFQESGFSNELLARAVVEEVLQEVGRIYGRESNPGTAHFREAILTILDKRGLPQVKERYQKHLKQPFSPLKPTTLPSPLLAYESPGLPSSLLPETYTARRRRLNEERKAITHKFQIDAYEGYLIVGLYDDGQPGEIFLQMNKEGSMLSGLMDSFATALSIGLQYGVPLKVFVKKFADVHFEPNGATQNPNIPQARSIMDYVARWLALKFLTPEERQTIFGLHGDQPISDPSLELTNIESARQSRLLDASGI